MRWDDKEGSMVSRNLDLLPIKPTFWRITLSHSAFLITHPYLLSIRPKEKNSIFEEQHANNSKGYSVNLNNSVVQCGKTIAFIRKGTEITSGNNLN